MAEDEARRRNEINMFAAMALGGEDALMGDNSGGDGDGSGGFDSGSVRIPPKKQDEMSAFAAAAGGDPNSIQNMFSQAAQSSSEMDSGTFAMTSKSSENAANAGESNLAAAVAALAIGDDDDDDDDNGGRGEGGGAIGALASSLPARMLASSSEASTFRKITEDYPMYAEEVRMPRPLFFGPILPPRVLHEARQIVNGALLDQGYNCNGDSTANGSQNLPRLSSLPPEVQNIVGALRTYGFGLSPFPPVEPINGNNGNKNEEGEPNQQPFWKGSSYLTSFQPVFGETARMFRHKKGVSASASAQLHNANQQQDEEEPKKQLLKSRVNSKSVTTSKPKTPMTETEKANASFLANISGGVVAGGSVNSQDDATSSDKASSPSEDTSTANNEISMFSMWARGEGAADVDGKDNDDDNDDASQGNISTGSAGSFTMETNKKKPARAKPSSSEAKQPEPMSDQDLFSKWARGESPSQNNNNNSSGTFKTEDVRNSFVVQDKKSSSSAKKVPPRFGFQSDPSGTFQRIPTTKLDNDSDDDSIVGSELKKKVGVNEHLDAALASLVDDGPTGALDRDDETDNAMLQMARTTPGGRPLSNLELTNGCVPIYGIDDSPLPVEGDLGIHETKNDEQRTHEQNRSQELIDKYVGPNLFGPVACPNPATGPDDNHSWNSRSAPSQRYNVGLGAGPPHSGPDRVAVLPVPSDSTYQSPKPPSGPPRKSTRHSSPKASTRSRYHSVSASSTSTPTARKNSAKGGGPTSTNKRGGRFNARHRYGWWSIPEDHEAGKGGAPSSDLSVVSASSGNGTAGADESAEEPFQLPPMHHTSLNLHVDTRLQPGPEQLRDENLPLSELHSATSMAHGLPYLSDRPPSYRYLQIDTQAVGFPPLGGEVEPLFCSLAIYNVETVNGGANDATSAPMPDLQRCGRVTEVLNFDVVSDQQVEDRCIGSLWPFFSSSTMTPQSSKSDTNSQVTSATLSENPSLQGTRCGVFPLPSNLNVANLYAVLIVQKVLSEDSDFEIYLKQSKSSRSSGGIDMNKFRTKAEKASNQHGSFLMPFAFGVAPLLQVFGADNPVVASSRAVQIPLFRFSAGLGERQIIDHIMVMLYPRCAIHCFVFVITTPFLKILRSFCFQQG